MQQYQPSANGVAHFAINADDIARARAFYETVFGWSFSAWGPPNFLMIDTGTAPQGSLQGRRELVPGTRTVGFECTVAVSDLTATVEAVRAAGGKIIMGPVTIPTVGDLIMFEDTEGNVAGAMQYA